jgi:predicted outer membrane protein
MVMRSAQGWSLALLVCLAGVAVAQVRTQPRPAGQRPAAAPPAAAAPAAATTQQGTPDQQVAACLWGANRNEVELAKLAQQKAQHESVKDFAAQMIKDHTQNADKLARVAGNLVNVARGGVGTPREVRRPILDEGEERREGREEAREERREGREEGAKARGREEEEAPAAERREGRDEAREERRTGREEAREDRRETRPLATAVAGGRQGFNWVTIHRELADQCLESSKKELNDKQANEFDKCYMGMQVAAHMKMLDELKVLKNHVSSQFSQDLEQSIETTEHHLSEAKKIMEEIKDKPDSAGGKNQDK